VREGRAHIAREHGARLLSAPPSHARARTQRAKRIERPVARAGAPTTSGSRSRGDVASPTTCTMTTPADVTYSASVVALAPSSAGRRV
jgi:hypothetical protein